MSLDRKRPYIFVVDDEHLIATSLAMILRDEGFDCKSFIKPMEALYSAKCEAPDLLITDIVMPVMSGIQLALEFEKDCPDCRILLFSGTSQIFGMMEEAKTFGRNFERLQKPAHPRELLHKVRTLLCGSAAQSLSAA